MAVVSMLGDGFEWTECTLLRFNWKHGSHEVRGWDIDAGVEQVIRQTIQTMPSFTLTDIAETKAELLAATQTNNADGIKLKMPEFVQVLQALKGKHGVDALIAVSRGAWQHFPLTSRAVAVGGNGVLKETELAGLGKGRIALYSTVTVDVYDTKTADKLASNQGFRWIHVDQALFDECKAGKGLAYESGLKSTVKNMIHAAVRDGIRYLRLSPIPEQTNYVALASDQLHRGIPLGSKLAKIATGMSMREVYDQLGQPTSAVLYFTSSAINPFYAGSDQVRFDALYQNEGRITFAGAGPGGTSLKVFEVKNDSQETGYGEQHKYSMPLYRVGREGCLNRVLQ